MMGDLPGIGADDVGVILHAAAHNPTGADLSPDNGRAGAICLNALGAIAAC